MLIKYLFILLLIFTSRSYSAITYEAISTQAEGSNIDSTIITKPTGTAEDDCLIAIIGMDGIRAITPPAGWTKITEIGGAVEENTPSLGVWYKIAGASEPASYVFNASGVEQWWSAIIRYDGTDLNEPIDHAITAENAGDATITTPVVYTSVDSCVILSAFIADDDDTPYNSPTGWNERYNGVSNTGANTCGGAGADTILTDSRGYSPPRTFTQNAAEEWIAITIAIRPEEVGIVRFGNDSVGESSQSILNFMRASTEATFTPADSMIAESLFIFCDFDCGSLLDDWDVKAAVIQRSDRSLVCTTDVTVIDNAAGLDWHGFNMTNACTLSPNIAYDLTIWCDSCEFVGGPTADLYYSQPVSPVYYGLYEYKDGLSAWENPWTPADSTAGRLYSIFVKGAKIEGITEKGTIMRVILR